MPGTDPDEAARTVVGELPGLPHLPELPRRGAGADITGRAAAILVDLPVEVWPSGWRITGRPGRDLERARGMLSHDLDALEEHTQGYTGALKLQIAGPWTLAATVELGGGERMLADPGAVADLCASHREGVAAHLAAVARRVPGARLLLQVDEPALPAVLRGDIPTASGYARLPAVDRVVVEERLRALFAAVEAAGAVPAAHCCATAVPVDLLRRSGARALSLDVTRLDPGHDEAIGTAVEGGTGLLLGVVPATEDPAAESGANATEADAAATRATRPRAANLSDPAATVDPIRQMWHRIGLDPNHLTRAVVVTPTCGMAGAAPDHARAALVACRDSARVLRDEPRR